MIEPCQALRRYPLFALLSPDWLDAWVGSAELHTIEAGQTLFSVGSAGMHIYLILSGKVRVLRLGSGGREISMGILRPGEVFGEYALLAPGLNTATCRAAEAGQVLCLPLPPMRERITAMLEGRSRLKNWLRLHYVLAHLRDHPSLGFMSATSFLPLLERFESIRFAAGTTIQTEGLHDDRWFVIQSGRACVGGAEVEEEGREVGPGDCFGELALLGAVRAPLVRALSEVRCQMLRRTTLDHPIEAAPLVSVQTVMPARGAAARCHEWVAQQGENDCGVAALAMVARVLGRHLCVKELRQQMRVQEQGTSLEELHRTAVQLGFRAQAVRIGMVHLGAVRMPAIAHLTSGHYVVLFELLDGSLVVGDPASGMGQWALIALHRCWSGQLLLITSA